MSEATRLCNTKGQRQKLTNALRELGILPGMGRLTIDVQGSQVVQVQANGWRFSNRTD